MHWDGGEYAHLDEGENGAIINRRQESQRCHILITPVYSTPHIRVRYSMVEATLMVEDFLEL